MLASAAGSKRESDRSQETGGVSRGMEEARKRKKMRKREKKAREKERARISKRCVPTN